MISLAYISPIHFSRNPILLNFTATDANGMSYRATGAGAALITDMPNLPYLGNITISWTAPDLTTNTATFRINDDLIEPNDIPSNIIGIAGVLRQNPKLAPHFFIESDQRNNDNWLIIEARDASANFIVTISYDFTVSSPYTISTQTWLTTPTTKPDDYKIQVIIYFEETFFQGNWRVAKTFDIELEEDGTIIPVDISNILNNECERTITENPFLKYTDNAPALTDNTRRWNVQYRKIIPTVATTWNTSNTYFVINGGIPHRIFLQENYNFFTSRNTTNSLFTYKNNVRKVIRGQKEYLSWYNASAFIKTARLKITHRTTNTGELDITHFQIEIPAHFTATFPISPQALNLADDTIYYIVTIEDLDGTPLSTQPIWCIIEKKYFRSIRNIAYINAFGCPETQLATGDFSKSVSIDRTLSTGTRFDTYGRATLVSKAKRAQYNIFFTYKLNPVTAIESEQLTELELSPVLFDLTDSLQLALVLKDSRVTIKSVTDTGESFFEKEIVAEPRIDMVNFAPDSVLFGATYIQNVLQSVGSNGTGIYTPTDPTNTTGTGANLTIVELGAIQDTDMVMFAKLNQNGTLGGYLMYPVGKLMRHTRGIPLDSTSHLNGLGLTDPSAAVYKMTINSEKETDFQKQ